MPDAVSRTLILAVPGTQDTQEITLEALRARVARGEIAGDNWVWSPEQNDWVPLAQLPVYAAALAPVEPSRVIPVSVKQPVAADSESEPVPVVRAMAGTYYSAPIEDHHEFPIFKILFVVLGVVIAALVGVNYFLVDQPFRASLAKTPFSAVQAHAHLAAFVQPTTLLIHVVPSPQITGDNFADFLSTLAQSTPRAALAGETVTTLALTSQWLSQYVMESNDWNALADMSGFTPEEKREFVLHHLMKSDGLPLDAAKKNDSAAVRLARETEAWKQLVAGFRPQ